MKKEYPFIEGDEYTCSICGEEFILHKLTIFEHLWNKHLDHPSIKAEIYNFFSKDYDQTLKGPRNRWLKFKNWFKD